MRKNAIASLGLLTSTGTAARITSLQTVETFGAGTAASPAHADQVGVLGFQWVSGTATIGDSTVAAGGTGAFCILDTTSRLKEFRTDGVNNLPIRDFWVVGTATFICYYQCY